MFGIPQISVRDVADKRLAGEMFVLLDVREELELSRANLGDGVEMAPLSQLAETGLDALPPVVRDDKDAEIVVFCHHGGRSAQVVGWLRQQGWGNVWNMDGGIHRYALEVDRTVGIY